MSKEIEVIKNDGDKETYRILEVGDDYLVQKYDKSNWGFIPYDDVDRCKSPENIDHIIRKNEDGDVASMGTIN